MRESTEPLVNALTMLRAQTDEGGKPISFPWEYINNIITREPNGVAIDEESFNKWYNSEQPGILNNIIDITKDGVDTHGIHLVPTNQPVEKQPVIDPSHSIVSTTAMQQLKRQK